MALIYPAEDASGIGVNSAYWRVIKIEINVELSVCVIRVAPYKSKKSRDDGKPASVMLTRDFVVDKPDFMEFFDADVVTASKKNHVSQAYSYLKSKTEFSTAQDA